MKQPLASIFALLLCLIIGCVGRAGDQPVATVHASGPLCFAEKFYDGVKETADYLWFATDNACDIGTLQDQSYTLKFDHMVQQAIVQQGSNTGSIFEWDLIVTFTRPDGRSFSIQQQYDKHQDTAGNRQVAYNYSVPQFLPAGTNINLHRRDLPSGYCLVPGPWGPNGGQACATGQSVQLIGIVK